MANSNPETANGCFTNKGFDNVEIGQIIQEYPISNGTHDTNPVSAIEVSNLKKSYGSNSILKGLSLNVKAGNIYALLGASGCGKTTLISCILGLRKYDTGSISVFGSPPGTKNSGIPGPTVGYMPQEVALFGDFTIQETLQYFGRILGMKEKDIKEKSEFLIKLLKLPSKDRFVNTLSGGQQRRTSFAVALLHSPKLLILDEPTVGVDSVLRQSIWDYLKELVRSQNTTIIITTHYIAEAQDADMVGLIREGRLLLEDTPKNAMLKYSCDNLDDVVLKVCLNDVSPIEDSDAVMNSDNLTEISSEKKSLPVIVQTKIKSNKQHQMTKTEPVKMDMKASFNRLKALVTKNLLSLWRQALFVFILIFLPGIQLLICTLAIGREPFGLGLGVVNYEHNLMNISMDSCPHEKLSCRFIQRIHDHDSIKLKHYQTEEDALEAANLGQTWGYFTFGANYSRQVLQRQADGVYAENDTIDESLVRVHMDMTNFQIAVSLQKVLFESLNKYSIEMLEESGNNVRSAELPIKFEKPLFGSENSEFTEFMAPATLLSLIFFMAISLTGVVYITEKKSGVMERSLVSGVTPFEIILSHVISQYAIMVIQTVITLAILVWGFNIQIYGSLHAVLFLVVLQGTLGMFLGFLLSTICDDEKTVLQLIQAITMPAFVLSGIVWPTESMPTVMRYISLCMPQTLASESIRSLMTRGWSIVHPAVWPGFAVTTSWIVVFGVLTIFLAKRH